MNPHTTTGTTGWAIRVTTGNHTHYATPHGPVEALDQATGFTHDYAAAIATRITTGTTDLTPTGHNADTGWAIHYTTAEGTTGYIPVPGPLTGPPGNAPADDSPDAHHLDDAASMTREYAESVAHGIAAMTYHTATTRLEPTGRPIDTPVPVPATNNPV